MNARGGLLPLIALWSGCFATKIVTVPVELATTTVGVAGETAGAVVKTTGKVAVSAVHATGSVASNGLESAARLSRRGMVTFVDLSTGTVARVPWQQGLTLASASGLARVQLAAHAVDVVRAGRVAYSATKRMRGVATLESGDVVRLSRGE